MTELQVLDLLAYETVLKLPYTSKCRCVNIWHCLEESIHVLSHLAATELHVSHVPTLTCELEPHLLGVHETWISLGS